MWCCHTDTSCCFWLWNFKVTLQRWGLFPAIGQLQETGPTSQTMKKKVVSLCLLKSTLIPELNHPPKELWKAKGMCSIYKKSPSVHFIGIAWRFAIKQRATDAKEFITYGMRVQVPYGLCSKGMTQDSLWKTAKRNRQYIASFKWVWRCGCESCIDRIHICLVIPRNIQCQW